MPQQVPAPSLLDIALDQTGANLVTAMNTNNATLEASIATASHYQHNHEGTYSEEGHTHNASEIMYDTTNVDDKLTYLQSQIDGLSISATISSIEINGTESGMPSLICNTIMSVQAYGMFDFSYYFDLNPTGSSFTNSVSGSSPQLVINKPASGYDSYNKQYVHVRCSFKNLASETLSTVTAHAQLTKYAGNISALDIAENLTDVQIKAIAMTIGSMPTALANISNQISKTL